MALGVRAYAYSAFLYRAHQARQISFKTVEIENQRRSVNVRDRVTDTGRNPSGIHMLSVSSG